MAAGRVGGGRDGGGGGGVCGGGWAGGSALSAAIIWATSGAFVGRLKSRGSAGQDRVTSADTGAQNNTRSDGTIMLVFQLMPLDLASSLFCRQSAASPPVTAALTPRGLTAGVCFSVHVTVSLLWRAAWLKYEWKFDLSWKMFHFVHNYTQ